MIKLKLLGLAILLVGIVCLEKVWLVAVQPEVSGSLALEQFANPSLVTDTASRMFSTSELFLIAKIAWCGLALRLLPWRKIMKRLSSVTVLLLAITVLPGCIKPYHEAMLVDVNTSEVAILAETVNDAGQAVIAPAGKGENQSESGELIDYYARRVINARKVEIPYYWKQTSRQYLYASSTNGKWTPAARLIVVDTQPETREWNTASGNAIWVESRDSVGFSTGFAVTARINGKDAAIRFLANYPPATKRTVTTAGGDPFDIEVTCLDQIMDDEVRTKIQGVFAYEAAADDMNELRDRKQEIIDSIERKVVPYFEDRGITITTISQFGGFHYENKEIQNSIDNVFRAQQDEEVAKAESKAAEQRKVALRLVGEGEAQKALETSRGVAEGVKLQAQAEAEAIRQVADAKAYELERLQENPEAYLALKRLEIEMERLKSWDGKYPQVLLGGSDNGSAPAMLLNLGSNMPTMQAIGG